MPDTNRLPGTDIELYQSGAIPALNRPIEDIRMIIEENLAGQEVSEFDLLRVTMPAGGATRWDIPTPGGATIAADALSGVLVYHKRARSYWPSREANGTPPTCRGERMTVQIGGKSASKMWGIGNPGGDCKLCPFSQFGSSLDPQSEGQACKEKEIWFLLPPGMDSFLPIVVALPATSLSVATKYRLNVGAPLSSIVTTLTLVPDKNDRGQKYSKIVAAQTGQLDPADAGKAREYAALMRPIFDHTAMEVAGEPYVPAPAVNGDGVLDDERPLTREEAGF